MRQSSHAVRRSASSARLPASVPTLAQQNEHWRRIRAQRARPPAIAGVIDERRLVFQSAVAQAEELWDAAAVAGPRSRALPLFYCLSQAGRAICAAWSEQDEWQPRGHGLSGVEPEGVAGADFVAAYGSRVSGGDRGAFGMVADATASATFIGTSTTAQLWASIPTFPTPRALVGSLPRCLYLEAATPTESGQEVMQAVLGPTHALLNKPAAAAADLLAPFPTADGFEVTGERASLIAWAESRAIVAFPDVQGSFKPLFDVAERVPNEEGSLLGRTYVFRPPVGEERHQPPSHLMTLWALLFNLSQLTRYYPAGWVGALDADESEVAVTLDHGLELALALTPQLILDGLSGPIRRWVEEARQQAQAGEGAEAGEAAVDDAPADESAVADYAPDDPGANDNAPGDGA
jgi:hypothetical protein